MSSPTVSPVERASQLVNRANVEVWSAIAVFFIMISFSSGQQAKRELDRAAAQCEAKLEVFEKAVSSDVDEPPPSESETAPVAPLTVRVSGDKAGFAYRVNEQLVPASELEQRLDHGGERVRLEADGSVPWAAVGVALAAAQRAGLRPELIVDVEGDR